MQKKLHIGISSVYFDSRPEGICTGRLIRVLVVHGYRVTLYTSDRSKVDFSHKNLIVKIYNCKPREPRLVFKWWARWKGLIENNFFIWTQRVITDNSRLTCDIPDIFYARAWPHASWIPAYSLSKKYQRPLMLHLSDPFPPPHEGRPCERFLNNVQRMIDAADAITFTNTQTIQYQKRFVKLDEIYSHVLPHVFLKQYKLAEPSNQLHFYLIGRVYKHRRADELLSGFKKFAKTNKEAKLFFVGSDKNYIQPLIQQYELCENAIALPYTDDIISVMNSANALIAIDANVENPIYTTTKIIEYLNVNRPILSITPQGSPVDELLEVYRDTTITVNEYCEDAIAKGFEDLSLLNPSRENYDSRFERMETYLPNGVAKKFDEICDITLREFQRKQRMDAKS